MSATALKKLNDTQAALAAALDARDIDALESLLAPMAQAVAEVAAAGAWRERPELREDLIHTLKQADAVRGRLNYLADRNRTRLDRLVALTGTPRAKAYGRNGLLS